jgi:hypothetical protein
LATLLLHLCGNRNTNPGELQFHHTFLGTNIDVSNLSNHIPWIIIGICYACCMAILLIIRYVLSTENERRDNEQLVDSYDDIYIERIGKDGQVEQVKVDKVINIHIRNTILAHFLSGIS